MSTRFPLLPSSEEIHAEEVPSVGQSIEQLCGELESLREEFKGFREVVQKMFLNLRVVYSPNGNIPDSAASPTGDRWDKMKQKLGGKAAEVIQALQDHSALTRSQLRAVTASGMSTIDGATARLREMGLIVKVGDTWRLKD